MLHELLLESSNHGGQSGRSM